MSKHLDFPKSKCFILVGLLAMKCLSVTATAKGIFGSPFASGGIILEQSWALGSLLWFSCTGWCSSEPLLSVETHSLLLPIHSQPLCAKRVTAPIFLLPVDRLMIQRSACSPHKRVQGHFNYSNLHLQRFFPLEIIIKIFKMVFPLF